MAFAGTALFNLYTWLYMGSGQSLDQAAAAPPSFTYMALAVAEAIAAGILGGMAAAKLSTRTPYANALASALVYLAWSIVLFASPLKEAQADTASVIQAFALPIHAPCLAPISLRGCARRAKNDC